MPRPRSTTNFGYILRFGGGVTNKDPTPLLMYVFIYSYIWWTMKFKIKLRMIHVTSLLLNFVHFSSGCIQPGHYVRYYYPRNFKIWRGPCAKFYTQRTVSISNSTVAFKKYYTPKERFTLYQSFQTNPITWHSVHGHQRYIQTYIYVGGIR